MSKRKDLDKPDKIKNIKKRCVVTNCEFLCSDLEFDNRSFHRFPIDFEKRRIWLNALRLNERQINSRSLVCSKHFTSSDYNLQYLRKNSVPSTNISYSSNSENLMQSKFSSYDFEDEAVNITGK